MTRTDNRAEVAQSAKHLSDTLTGDQMTAILSMVLESPRSEPVSITTKVAEMDRLLERMGARLTISAHEVLRKAVRETVSVKELQDLKELAKQLLDGARDFTEREAAQLLYHLTIAAAFSRHGANISTQSVETWRAPFRQLAKFFSGHSIGEVFERADDPLTDIVNDRKPLRA